MTIEKIMKEIEKNKVCYIEHVYQVLSQRMDESLEFEEEQADEKRSVIELKESICNNEVQLIGPVETIHNVSVEYARYGCYDCACAVLKKGLDLNKYSKNVDLLADYLKYSTCSSQEDFDAAKNYYERLCSISRKRWNWRAYSFTIDYFLAFLNSLNIDEEEILNKCMQLATEYMEKLGRGENGDKAYHALANVYLMSGDDEKCQETLQNAISTLKKAPMCALQLAEMFFNNGMFNEAGKCVSQCISVNIDVDNSMGYPYVLSALCRIMSAYERIEEVINSQEKEDIIKIIKKDYELAKSILGDNEKRVTNLKKQIIILEKQLNIKDEDEIYEIG